MGLYCIVNGCKSTKYKRLQQKKEDDANVSLFRFPTNTPLRDKWIEALRTLNNQENASSCEKYGKICSLHFSNACIERRGCAQYRLTPNAIPSIFPHNEQNSMDARTHLADVSNTLSTFKTETSNTSTTVKTETPDSTFKTETLNTSTTVKTETPDSTFKTETPNTSTTVKSETPNTEATVVEFINVPGTSTSTMEIRKKSENALCATPTRKLVRYPGDISSSKLQCMSPRTLNECVHVLRKSCDKKDKIIKRLRTEGYRRKKRIGTLKSLLHELREKCELSANSSDMIEVIRQLQKLL